MKNFKPASKTAKRQELEIKLVEALIAQSKLTGTALKIEVR